MRVLIAEDDPISRRVLQTTLEKWGYEVEATADGVAALAALQRDDAAPLAILDWMMPGIDGVEVCRRLRENEPSILAYIILLTTLSEKSDIVRGLNAGANDYVVKPFDREELRARVQVGVRVIELQTGLAESVKKLEEALSQVRQLQGILPICSHCKRVRDDKNYWQQVESYVTAHSEAQFSHSICPECFDRIARPQIEEMRRLKAEGKFPDKP
ncbi:MAG TPA: response regulator [Blastocatellia bacterium]|nr:response regulator [Blastocatellia bacterium]